MLFITIDYALNVYFTLKTGDGSYITRIWKSNKTFYKSIFLLLLVSDYLNYITTYPDVSFRFGRIIRALLIISFSKDLRRNIKGIMNSIQILIILFLVYFIVFAVWSFIGINLIGDIKSTVTLDN
jgi:succinate dehydrogenase hydrophobic anchor subunit